MASSVVDVYNLALGYLGIDHDVAATTDTTPEARACNRYYEQARDEVLREFPWPFATREAALTLVTDNTALTDRVYEWGYEYRYPTDALRILRIQSGYGRRETNATRPRLRVTSDTTGRLIYADVEDAYLEYIAKITDVTMFPPDVIEVVARLLAAKIAPRLTTDAKIVQQNLQMYEWAKQRAMLNAANEHVEDVESDTQSGFYEARNGWASQPRFPYEG